MEWYEIAQTMLDSVKDELGNIPKIQLESFKHFIHDWLINIEENQRRLESGETTIEEDVEIFLKEIRKL